MLTGAGIWDLLKGAESRYLEWREVQHEVERYETGAKPVRQGHFYVCNGYREESLQVDYRVFIDPREDHGCYRVRSCLLQVDESGFSTIRAATDYMKQRIRDIKDEAGFSLEIIDEDRERVHEFDPMYRAEEIALIVPQNTDQTDWNH